MTYKQQAVRPCVTFFSIPGIKDNPHLSINLSIIAYDLEIKHRSAEPSKEPLHQCIKAQEVLYALLCCKQTGLMTLPGIRVV